MKKLGNAFVLSVGIVALLFIGGCAGGRDSHQFDPIPSGGISSMDLPPSHTAKGDFNPIIIPDPLPARVEYELKDIQTRYPKNFQTGLDRAQHYMPYILAAFEKEGVPTELVWLAMVESQFNTKAVSRAGASGMWQFMKPAASRFGLRMDAYVDDRFDWKRQTYAAIDYLKALYDFFDGDWELAVTAYNMGEGGLSRLRASHGGQYNFWELVEVSSANNTMREETQKYYPRFLASAMVAKNPEKYGFKTNIVEADNSAGVLVDGMYSLEDLDKGLGYAPGTLAKLNPGLIQGLTPPYGTYEVQVPRPDRETFMLALNTVPKRATGRTVYSDNTVALSADGAQHKVKRGETISAIARKYGVSQQELMATNNVKSAQSLRIGQNLRIPGNSVTVTASSNPPASTIAEYKVQKGDTLSSIATNHRVSVADLQAWNGKGKSTRLSVGETIKVHGQAANISLADNKNTTPQAPVEVQNAPTSTLTHTVKKGDTLSTIASKHGVSVSKLQEWNNKGKSTNLKVGENLKITTSSTIVTASNPTGPSVAPNTVHTVKKGETLSAIATRYGVKVNNIQTWNNMGGSISIREGQQLKLASAASNTEQSEATASKNSPTPALPNKTVHKVAKGDTPGSIAQKYGVSTRDLLAWNNLSPKSVIQINQELLIYSATRAAASEAESDAPGSMASNTSSPSLTHVVAKGQTPWNIAKQYGVGVQDLQRWNNWKNDHVLQVGDKVTILPSR